MGSVEVSIALVAIGNLTLGILLLLRARKGAYKTLGLLWTWLGVFDVSQLFLPTNDTWAWWGSYCPYTVAMLWIAFRGRLRPETPS